MKKIYLDHLTEAGKGSSLVNVLYTAKDLRLALRCLLVLWLGFSFSVSPAWAQQRTITGKVVDANGEGVPGVSVYVKETTRGTVTDFEGNYSLAASQGEVLVFQSIGYTTQEITVGAENTLDVSLAEDIQGLSEIVVVGYGTQQKKDLTGAITKIGAEDFNPGPVTNPLQQLTGRAAGVTINQVGSEPGQGPSIRVRGITTLVGASDPLVVIDGIQSNLGILNQIPPSEIESIDILKDASATAIYGSRGAAGVVLVTTKQGKRGKAVVEYSGTVALQTVAEEYDVLNAAEWRAAAEARGLSGGDFGGNTDWFDEVTRNAYTNTHNLAISGGSENFTYRTSVTALLEEGIVKKSKADNFIGRFQGTQTALNDKFKFSFNLNASVRNQDFNNGERIAEAITRRPTDPIFAPDGPAFPETGPYFIDQNSFAYINPLARTREIIDRDETISFFGSLRTEYEIIEGLTATAFGTWRRTSREYEQYVSPLTTREDARNIGATDLDGIATRQTNTSDEKLLNLILNYKKQLGDHSFDIIGVYEWQKQIFENYGATARGFLTDTPDNLNALDAANADLSRQGDVFSGGSDRTLVSFLGRVNYGFKDRYLLTLSYRRDGASVFGDNNEWGNFYAASAAWRISDEAFMSNVSFIDELKLRVGYGETGSQDALGPLNSVRLADPSGTTFFGGELIPNVAITQNANPDLQWEVRRMFNVGVDFGVLNDRLYGSVDYYYGITSELLFQYDVPQPPYPFPTIFANVGELLNQGVEVSLNYEAVRTNDFTVTLSGNLTANQTEVRELNGTLDGVPLETNYVIWGAGGTTGVASTNNAINHLIIGQPVGTFYLFRHAGVDDTGTQIIDDLDGDGVVEDGNRENDDRYIAGQALPKVTWAFTPSFTYKNFDLGLVLRGAHGHKIYNARRATLSALGTLGQGNVLQSALGIGINNITYASDLWLEDGDFVRLENISLGYNFNTSNWGVVKSFRLSFTANNLFVITDYSGIDPELNISGGGGSGIDNGIYPRIQSYALGLNVSFQ